MLKTLVIICISFCVALFGLSYSIPKVLSPLEHYGYFDKIYPDRWLADGATIKIPDLLYRGNQLEINFKDWHPAAYGTPRLEFSICGEIVNQFEAAPGSQYTIYLTGKCNPREVKFKSLNPFSVGGNDGRSLAVQIDHIKLKSKIGPPLPSLKLLLLTTCLIAFLLALCSYSYFLMLFVAAAAGPLIAANYFTNLFPLQSLYGLAFLLLLGGFIQRNQSREISWNLSTKLFWIFTVVVFFIGIYLRFYNLDFGLPLNFHPDEVPKYNAIQRMQHYNDLNPRYFLHPTMLLYSTYFFNNIINHFSDGLPWMETVVFSGRVMSATAGSLSVLLTCLIAKRFFNPAVGVLSGLFLAVFPLHVTCSRYVKEDALLVFFILLAVYFVLLAVQKEKPWVLLIAGFFAGMSASVKYSGLVSVMIIVGAPFIKSGSFIPDGKYCKWAVRALFIFPLAFLIGTPYSLLEMGTFLHDFNHERSHMTRGHSAAITAWSQLWTYNFSRSLFDGMQALPLAAAVCGLGYLLFTGKMKYWYLVALVLLYYVPAEIVKAKPAPQPERYAMPCLPFLAIAAAYFLVQLRQRWIVAMLCLLVFAQPAIRTFNLATELRPDTRDLMGEWMYANIPAGSHILIDWRPYAPQFQDNYFKIEFLPRSNILEALEPKKLKAMEADYLIMSSLYYGRYFSQPMVPANHRQIIRQVWRSFEEVKSFKSKHGSYGFHNPDLTLFKFD